MMGKRPGRHAHPQIRLLLQPFIHPEGRSDEKTHIRFAGLLPVQEHLGKLGAGHGLPLHAQCNHKGVFRDRLFRCGRFLLQSAPDLSLRRVVGETFLRQFHALEPAECAQALPVFLKCGNIEFLPHLTGTYQCNCLHYITSVDTVKFPSIGAVCRVAPVPDSVFATVSCAS